MSVFSGTVQARIFKHGIHMYCGIETQAHSSYFVFHPFFFLSLYFMLTLNFFIKVLSESVKA